MRKALSVLFLLILFGVSFVRSYNLHIAQLQPPDLKPSSVAELQHPDPESVYKIAELQPPDLIATNIV